MLEDGGGTDGAAEGSPLARREADLPTVKRATRNVAITRFKYARWAYGETASKHAKGERRGLTDVKQCIVSIK
jgi:hypothetical protein